MTINFTRSPIASAVKSVVTPLVSDSKVDEALCGKFSRTIRNWHPVSDKDTCITTIEFVKDGMPQSSYSKRKMENGNVFETFRVLVNKNMEVLKVMKDRFGTIIAAKANYRVPLDNYNIAYSNAQNTISANTKNLFNIKPSELI